MLQIEILPQLSLVPGKTPEGNITMAGLEPGSCTAEKWLLRISNIYPAT
jgi:hypothetical protein